MSDFPAEGPDRETLNCVENTHTDRDYTIELVFPEFTCVNPATDFPDFATLTIAYTPNLLCLDSLSLKRYLNAYREAPCAPQTAVNRIWDDLFETCAPREMTVTGAFTVRGGLTTTVKVRR